jgi:hypothetical protein
LLLFFCYCDWIGQKGLDSEMDVAAYLAGGETGDGMDEVMDRLKADAIRAVTPAVAAAPAERYESVGDYDPVLRAHCRL